MFVTRASTREWLRSAGRVRLIAAWVLCALATGGCGKPPEAVFVSSKKTQDLMRPAQRAVEQAVAENFGTPQSLVASLRLPVDYGVAAGAVKEGSGEGTNHFTYEWENPETAEKLQKVDLSGAAFLWDSGENVDSVIVRQKREIPVDFQVLYDHPEDQTLGLSVNLGNDPQPGDKFRVVGYGMQSGRRLYMQHCMHCHGVSGDGNGPTARYLNPLPRDYRLGIFKFTSTKSGDKVSRNDLHRIIRNGIPGTYMPSFLLLKESELTAIVEYVRWLSMRGEFEARLNAVSKDYSKKSVASREEGGEKVADIEKEFASEFDGYVENTFVGLNRDWTRAEEPSSVIHPKGARVDPAADPASIERGRKLYLSDKTKCASCHGLGGRGDGPQTTDYQKTKDGEEYKTPGLFDDWGNPIKPRDLNQGIYRGGRRPIDLYRRVYAGIKGTPMPAFNTALKDDEMWDVVNYVLSVPYHGKAPPALKEASETSTASTSKE